MTGRTPAPASPRDGCHVFTGADVFDGTALHLDAALVVEDGTVAAILPAGADLPKGTRVPLGGGILAPGLVDLQVNGGGGWQVDGTATADRLAGLCATHARLGSTAILPTLITDTPEATNRVIAAGIAAARAGVRGFLGLHLEGPHLDPRRRGAHDAALIRPITDADIARLTEAARHLPALMVTLAPEAVRPDQIVRLARAGVRVSLGHSDCTHAEARTAIAAGATCVTHLFNAMSQMGHRAPGLVGAVLAGDVAAGLIADGVHVHPEVLAVALAARQRGLFLVSDCMAFAGHRATEMLLGGRHILRRDGRLTLEDGTLAGADLTLAQATNLLVRLAGASPARALAMATSVPAGVIGAGARHGQLLPGRGADMVLLRAGHAVGVWQDGQRLPDPQDFPGEGGR